MNAEQYSILALRTAPVTSMKEDLLHAAMGIGGESGEVIDILKKHHFYGKALDHKKVIEEIGDAAWYFNMLIHLLGSSWDEVFEVNIRKLEVRYPNLRFDPALAINRDTVAEKAAMMQIPEPNRELLVIQEKELAPLMHTPFGMVAK